MSAFTPWKTTQTQTQQTPVSTFPTMKVLLLAGAALGLAYFIWFRK